jgi:hypothetical protein
MSTRPSLAKRPKPPEGERKNRRVLLLCLRLPGRTHGTQQPRNRAGKAAGESEPEPLYESPRGSESGGASPVLPGTAVMARKGAKCWDFEERLAVSVAASRHYLGRAGGYIIRLQRQLSCWFDSTSYPGRNPCPQIYPQSATTNRLSHAAEDVPTGLVIRRRAGRQRLNARQPQPSLTLVRELRTAQRGL